MYTLSVVISFIFGFENPEKNIVFQKTFAFGRSWKIRKYQHDTMKLESHFYVTKLFIFYKLLTLMT